VARATKLHNGKTAAITTILMKFFMGTSTYLK